MARFKDAEPILTAAEHWNHRSLRGEQSLFTGRAFWTRPIFRELQALYTKARDDPSPDRFEDR